MSQALRFGTAGAPPFPSKIVAVGRNYSEHAAELGNAVPDEEPLLFLKAPSSLVFDGGDIVLPPESEYHGVRAIVLDSIHGRGLSPSATAAYRALYHFAEKAKAQGLVVIMVGHVTKQGTIAGPKTLQHNVDCIVHMQRAL